MKFLIFNLTVAAALVYLLTTDRAEVQNAAGRIHDAASEMKQAAGRVVERGRRWVTQTPPETAVRPSSPAAPPADPIAKPAAMDVPLPPAASRASPVPKIPVSRAKEAAAAKRRAEILRGIDPAVLIPGPKPEAEPAQPALLPAERRKQLDTLSEEMELFYARTLGQ